MSDQTGVTQNSSSPQGERPVWSLLSTINAANNQITTSGYTYDAAGNMTNDTVHSYAYDAEGNITKVDGGSTAQYVYDVFNHRIHVQTASATNEFVYDPMGRRVSTWLSPNNYGSEGRIRWDGRQIGYRSTDGTTYFDHQDMLGTERMRTTYSGTVGSTYTSLPWGDGYTATVNTTGADQDNGHFAGLDRDAESDTEHAQFRNYASAQGRWLAPDSYLGSYDLTNPQSMNRYAYALNNPTSSIDPSGLEDEQGCGDDDDCGGDGGSGDGGSPPGCSPSCTDQNGNGYTGTSTGGISGGPGTTVDVNADTGNNGFDGSYLDGGNIPQDPNGPGNAPSNVVKNLQCAAKYGQAHSIGALFGGGTIANFLGGNSVSGLVNLGLSVTGQQPFSSAPNLTGLGLGLPVNDILRLSGGQTNPLYGSASGTIRSTAVQGIFNAATESGAISSIAAEGGELAVQGGLTAGEFASGVGIAKFGLDLGTFLVGYYSCATK